MQLHICYIRAEGLGPAHACPMVDSSASVSPRVPRLVVFVGFLVMFLTPLDPFILPSPLPSVLISFPLVSIAALFKLAKKGKQPKCLSAGESEKGMWYLCTICYFFFFGFKWEWNSSRFNSMDGSRGPCESSQAQKCSMVPLICSESPAEAEWWLPEACRWVFGKEHNSSASRENSRVLLCIVLCVVWSHWSILRPLVGVQ